MTEPPRCQFRTWSGEPCTNYAVKTVPAEGRWCVRWWCGIDHSVPPKLPARDRYYGGAGNHRNAPCPCGSGRKFKHCCLSAREVRS